MHIHTLSCVWCEKASPPHLTVAKQAGRTPASRLHVLLATPAICCCHPSHVLPLLLPLLPLAMMAPRPYDDLLNFELTAEQAAPGSPSGSGLPSPAFRSKFKLNGSPRNRAVNLPVSPAPTSPRPWLSQSPCTSAAPSRAHSRQSSRAGTPCLSRRPSILQEEEPVSDEYPEGSSPPPPYRPSSPPAPASPLLSPTPHHAQPCLVRIAERRIVLASSSATVPMSSAGGMKRKVVILGSPSVGE